MAHRRDLLPTAAAALPVIPYLTLSLSFRQALIAQAALILAVTAALALAGLRTEGWRARLRSTRRPLWTASGLWTAAAAVGLGAALAAGNEGQRIAGQLLALILFPLGLLAGRLAPAGSERFRRSSQALAAAVAAACLVHFGVWAVAAAQGLPPKRLYLGNSVSVAGAVPLVLVLLLALRPAPRWRGAAVGIFVLYLAGSGSRGAWLAALLGAGALFLLGRPAGTPKGAGSWRWLTVPALLLPLSTGLFLWLDMPRHNELPSALPSELLAPASPDLDVAITSRGGIAWNDGLRQRILVHRFAARPETAYRLRGWFRGGDRGHAYAAARWVARDGRVLGRFSVDGRPSELARRSDAIVSSPAGTAAGVVLIGCRPGSVGGWELTRLELHRLGPGALAPALRQLGYLSRRVASLLDGSALRSWRRGQALGSPEEVQPGDALREERGGAGFAPALEDLESMEFRVAESAELWYRFQGAPLSRKLWGHGLGATFRLAGRDLHYVHNFYAYLLFKLGLAGGLLLLAGAGVLVRSLLRWHRRRGEPHYAAAAAVWLAYLAWGAVSPELLDFRLAPLFGMLLAALPPSSPTAGEGGAEVL